MIVADEKAITQIAQSLKMALQENNKANPYQLLNRREVADILGIDYKAVRRLVQSGAIKTTADGRYIPRASLDEYTKIKISIK